MPRFLSYLQQAVKSSPWIHLAVLPPALVAALSYAASATPAQEAAAWSAATVLGTLGAGLLKRPVHAAVSAATVTTIAGNLAVLGLHLPPSGVAAVLAVVSALSPAAAQIAPSALTAPLTVPPASAAPAASFMTPVPGTPPPGVLAVSADPQFPAGL